MKAYSDIDWLKIIYLLFKFCYADNEKKASNIKLTLLIEKGNHGYLVGQSKELPEVLSQGKTEKELHENILDALQLVLKVGGSKNFDKIPKISKSRTKTMTLNYEEAIVN
jgi:predicted RNase H-like HicB family nuclease